MQVLHPGTLSPKAFICKLQMGIPLHSNSKKLEYGFGVIYVGFPSSCVVGSTDGHSYNFLALLDTQNLALAS